MAGSNQVHGKGAPVNVNGGPGEEPVTKLYQVFGKMAQEINLVMRSLEHMKDAVADATSQMRRLAVIGLAMAGPKQHIPFGIREWLGQQGFVPRGRGGFRGGGPGKGGGGGSPGGGGGLGPADLPPKPGGTARQVIGGRDPVEAVILTRAQQAKATQARAQQASAAHAASLPGPTPGQVDPTIVLNQKMAGVLERIGKGLLEEHADVGERMAGTTGAARKHLKAQRKKLGGMLRDIRQSLGDNPSGGGYDAGDAALVGQGGRPGSHRFLGLRPELLENVRVTADDAGLPAGVSGYHSIDPNGRSNVRLAPGASAGTRRHEFFHAFMGQARVQGESTNSLAYDAINAIRSQTGLGGIGKVLEEATAHGIGTGKGFGNFFTSGMAGRYAKHYAATGQLQAAAVAGTGHLVGQGAAGAGRFMRSVFEAGKPHVRDFWKDFTHYGRGVLRDRAAGRQTGLERFAAGTGTPFLAGTAAYMGVLKAASPDMFETVFKSFGLMLAKMGPAVIPTAAKASKLAQDAGDWMGNHPRLVKAGGLAAGAVIGLTALGLVTAKVASGFRSLAAAAALATRGVTRTAGFVRGGGIGRFANSRGGRLAGAVAGGLGGALAGQMLSSKVSGALGFSEGSTGDLLTMAAVDSGVGALGARFGMRGFKGAGRAAARYALPAAALMAGLDQAASNRKDRRGEFQKNEVGFRDLTFGFGDLLFGNRREGETLGQKTIRTLGGALNRTGIKSDAQILTDDLIRKNNPVTGKKDYMLVRNQAGELGQSTNPEDVRAHETFMRKSMLQFMANQAMEGRLNLSKEDEQDFEKVRKTFLKEFNARGGSEGKIGDTFRDFLKQRLAGTDKQSKADSATENYYKMARSSQTTAQFMTVEDAWRSAMIAGLKDPLEQATDTENEKNLAIAMKEMMAAQTALLEETKKITGNTGQTNAKLNG